MSETFSIIISAATHDEKDCAIHIREQDGKERQMMWCRFSDQPELDQIFIDELMCKIAKLIASNKAAGMVGNKQENLRAKEVVDDALARIAKG